MKCRHMYSIDEHILLWRHTIMYSSHIGSNLDEVTILLLYNDAQETNAIFCSFPSKYIQPINTKNMLTKVRTIRCV